MNIHPAVFGHAVAGLCASLLVSCGGGGYGDGGSPPPATLNMSVAPTTITLGQSATITWNSNAGTSCTASGAWSGTKAASGSEMVTPTQTGTLTYTLRCSGGGYGDSQTMSVTLMVNAIMGFTQTPLVSRFAGTAAPTTDPMLVDPRGIAFAPSGPVWIANSRTSIAYDGNGRAQSPPRGLAANVSANTVDIAFELTGIVSATPDFVVTANGKFGSAKFIYAGKGGIIGGWAPDVDPANALTMYVGTDGAVYTGLAMAINGSDNFLYATDFHNNKIDVFDANFTRQTPSIVKFSFSDPTLPAGFAPFGIQAIENGAAGRTQIYVTYAQQMPPDDYNNAIGAGLGLVNVFDTNGNLLRHLVPAGGALNAPWGIAVAPADFGTLSHSLLIGNFGDGKINAYNPASGKYVGTVSDADGRSIVTRGLWGMAFGNDSNNQPHNTLFFAAGTDEADSTYGRIDLGTTPPMLEVTTRRH